MEIRKAKERKKAYIPPKVLDYGTVREITAAIGTSGMGDNGIRGANRTSP